MTPLLSILWFLLPFSVVAASDGPAVGVVANQDDFHDGGCELVLSSDRSDRYGTDRYIFMSDFNGRAVMNLDGHDIRLMLVRSTESRKQPKIGRHTRFWYSSGLISVEIDYTLTGVCRPDDESCEVFYYNAVIRVQSGLFAKTVRAKGLCGT
jgi:hypothetical protein